MEEERLAREYFQNCNNKVIFPLGFSVMKGLCSPLRAIASTRLCSLSFVTSAHCHDEACPPKQDRHLCPIQNGFFFFTTYVGGTSWF